MNWAIRRPLPLDCVNSRSQWLKSIMITVCNITEIWTVEFSRLDGQRFGRQGRRERLFGRHGDRRVNVSRTGRRVHAVHSWSGQEQKDNQHSERVASCPSRVALGENVWD